MSVVGGLIVSQEKTRERDGFFHQTPTGITIKSTELLRPVCFFFAVIPAGLIKAITSSDKACLACGARLSWPKQCYPSLLQYNL